MLSKEENALLDSLINETINPNQIVNTPYYPNTNVMMGGGQKPNLVEWQLDFKNELVDIERLLRSDIKVYDEKLGRDVWKRNPNKAFVVFNDQGVNDILREIRMFLNKNTVLSNYKDEEIRLRIRQFGHELRGLIYNNYEEYGLDNEYKINNYPIMTITILQMVESAYRRAMNGEERRDLNSFRTVNQTEGVNQPNGMYPMMPIQTQKKGIFSKLLGR